MSSNLFHLFSAAIAQEPERRVGAVDQHPAEGDGRVRQADADARIRLDGKRRRHDDVTKSRNRIRLLHPDLVI